MTTDLLPALELPIPDSGGEYDLLLRFHEGKWLLGQERADVIDRQLSHMVLRASFVAHRDCHINRITLLTPDGEWPTKEPVDHNLEHGDQLNVTVTVILK